MRFVYSIFLLFTLLASSCTDPAQQNQPNVYYDVLGYVKGQIAEASAKKPLITKTVAINEKRNQQTTRDINWSRELELFTQADINKPALRSSYQVNRPDSLTYKYTLKNSEERLTVRSLTVRLDAATRKPTRIDAVLQTNNPLYSSERRLLLESGPGVNRQWSLQHYTVSGFQKLPYFDKNEFLVDGRLK
ncbi:hypothetical protein [Spirosoma pollinicola]|uniref:LPS export ABC transporter periplasmic protein LptC n=1 Tax=Spirosoma pollinicola TaxID=2057025 RepID=A0A2K8Z5R6_9BACT|nr:hypothetical protein [Spirosoma pollinicola]AUD05200.1 hypothetical protein CWM47_27160 [Spirosoma pollinicola]